MPEENNNQIPQTPESEKVPEPQKDKPEATTSPEDPIQEIVAQLRKSQSRIMNTELSAHISELTQQAADPLRVNQRDFGYRVAYAAQDVERQIGPLELSTQARSLVDRFATSVPDLENERLAGMMRATAYMSDQASVRDVRRMAKDVSRQVDQNTTLTQDRIVTLENRVRLGPRAESAEQSAKAEKPQEGKREEVTPQQSSDDTADLTTQNHHQSLGQSSPTGSAKSRTRVAGSQQQAPWQPAYTPLAGRLSAFQKALSAGRDDIAIRDAEKAANTASDAFREFRTGVGATVMNQIDDAARTEGLSTVLSGMREGGRFQELRHQFDNAMTQEEGFARAYDRAASALAQYGEKRVNLEQVIANRPDSANLTKKFQQLDADIGQAAEEVPSRHQGENMLADLGKRAGEIVQKAVDAVQNLFGRNAAPNASSPSPSPR